MKESIQTLPQASLRGALSLDFEQCESTGNTRIRNAYRTGLFHFSKPYWDGRQLVVQTVNPTAGIFEGDHLESRYIVGPGARACLISPSSTQVYSMPGQAVAKSRQSLTVEDGGSCAFVPKWLVLHKGARLQQTVFIDLKGASRLLYADLLSAGRASFGEFLAFDQFLSRTEVRSDGKLLLRERMECGKELNRWIWMAGGKFYSHLATVYIKFPHAGAFVENVLSSTGELAAPGAITGFSVLSPDFVMVRMLSVGTIPIQASLKQLYGLLEEQTALSPVVRRIL